MSLNMAQQEKYAAINNSQNFPAYISIRIPDDGCKPFKMHARWNMEWIGATMLA